MSSTITGTPLFEVDHTASGVANGAEVSAYDAARKLVYILGPDGVDALDVATGAIRFSLPLSATGIVGSMGGTSVAVHGDMLAVSYEGAEDGLNGNVAFYSLAVDGSGATLTGTVEVGATPDMIKFTPDGSKLLVAIEAEPFTTYANDPVSGAQGDAPGGISIIDTATMTETFAGFGAFDADALRAAGVRIKAGATAAADLEPEYIALSADGTKAYVTLQENNAIAVLDVATGAFENVYALGIKDHSLPGNGMDTSDRDTGVNIRNVPVKGLYMPDGLASFEMNGKTYLVTANEGDAREYDAYADVGRLASANLDVDAFGGADALAELKKPENLGRLNISLVDGDSDGDGDIDVIHTLGGRSMSIWEVGENGLTQTWDSGDMMERILAADFPALLNDSRSDDKGPEPESVTVGMVDGKLYAFAVMERSHAVMAFRIDGPDQVTYAGVIETGAAEPEVVTFISAEDAPGGIPMLIAPNEGDGVTTGIQLSFPILGSEAADVLRGSRADNFIDAGAGDDLIFASLGQDTIEGGAGNDTLRFEGLTLGGANLGRAVDGSVNAVSWTDAAGSHATSFTGIETVQMVDSAIHFGGDSMAAQVSSLYRALLGRDADTAGLSYWVGEAGQGKDLATIAGEMMQGAESQAALDGPGADALVARLYEAVLDRTGSAEDVGYWVGRLEAGDSLAQVAAAFAVSTEAATDPTGAAAQGLIVVDAEMAWIGRSYEALLGRAADLGGLSYYDGQMQAGVDQQGVVQQLAGSQEFGIRTAGLDNAAFVEGLYQDVLGRGSDAEGLAWYVAELEAGAGRGEVAFGFLASDEGQAGFNRFLEEGVSLI
jgi:DNA-binding beta-propeller fold protein YncE